MQKIFSVAGGSVQANDGLYLHRAADDELLELCRAGAFTYVLTPRQMGKSSLMVRTAERLSDEGVTSVIIDLQEIGVELTAEQWYYGLVAKIDERVSPRADVKRWWKEHESLGLGQRLTLFLKDVLMAEAGPDERVVIFVDEIDTTLGLKFTDDFFTAVRSIYGARANEPCFRRLSFVLIGVATPSDLISDPRRTPFNIGQRVDLTDFTFEEALPLARGLGLPEAESQDVLRRALDWTGGHPFLTQQLCAAIAAKGRTRWTLEDVDAVVAEQFLGEDFARNSNLLFVRDMLTKRAPDRESVLNTYAEVLRGGRPVADEGQSVPKSHLKLSGVVCAEDGSLRVRNKIYREVFDKRWVRKHNPPNWTKRLTRAAAALVAVVLFLMFPVGVFALYQWQRASAALDEAISERNLARRARGETESLRRIAEERRVEAEEQRRIAEEARVAAEKSADKEKSAKTEAEDERNKAIQAAAEAERQRQNAETQKAAADKLRLEAEAQKTIAEKQKKLAEQSQLVAQSLLAQKADNYQHAALLAREALRPERFDTLSMDAYQVLSQSLSLLPRPLMKYRGLAPNSSLSEDGRYLLAAQSDDPNTLKVYDAANRETDSKTVPGLKALAFSPDRKYLLTAAEAAGPSSDDSGGDSPGATDSPLTAKLWQWSEGELKELPGGLSLGAGVEKVALGPGGKLVAVARRPTTPGDTHVHVEVKKVDEPTALPEPFVRLAMLDGTFDAGATPAIGLAFSKDGRRIALLQKDAWVVWEDNDGKGFSVVNVARQDKPATAFALSPDGKRLAVVDIDNVVTLWSQYGEVSAEEKNPLFNTSLIRRLNAAINDLAFTPDGQRLVTAGQDGTARLWPAAGNIIQREEEAVISHGSPIEGVSFGAGGTKLLTTGDDGTARVWEVPGKDGSLSETVFDGASVVTESPKRNFVLLSDSKEFRVWDVAEGRFAYRVDAGSAPGQLLKAAIAARDASSNEPTVFLEDDGRHLIAYTADDEKTPKSEASSTGWRMRYLDLAEGREVWKREGGVPGFVKMIFSPSGKYLALPPDAGSTDTATVIALQDGKEVLSLDAQERESFHFECFTSDGDHLVVTRRPEDEKEKGMTVRVLEIEGGRKVGEWRAESEPTLELTPGGLGVKGGYLAGVDGQGVTVWEAFNGRVVNRSDLSRVDHFSNVVFSPDGEHFAIPGQSQVSVWKLGRSDRPVLTIPYSQRFRSSIFYSQTGEFIYEASHSYTIVWSAETGCEVADVVGDGERYLNAGGTRALTVDAEKGGAVWRKVGLGELLAEVCGRVTRNLSLKEWRNDYRLPADAPPLKCENIKDDTKDETADTPEQGGVCNLPGVH